MKNLLFGTALKPLKIVAVVHLCAVALQPVLAGQYFSGHIEALVVHGVLGETAGWLAITQALLAILCARYKSLNRSAAGAFVGICILDGIQIHAGHAKALALHVPLGTALFALSLLLTVWLWRRPAAQALQNS
jgi:hypothetical protein